MLMRASGDGQLLVLRAIRFAEERALAQGGVTAVQIAMMTGRRVSSVSKPLRGAVTSARVVRWPVRDDPRAWTYHYEVTDQGHRWLDLQERYGAPPDQFRDPAAFAIWKARHPNMPFFVKVDLRVHPVRAVPWSRELGAIQRVPEFKAPWGDR